MLKVPRRKTEKASRPFVDLLLFRNTIPLAKDTPDTIERKLLSKIPTFSKGTLSRSESDDSFVQEKRSALVFDRETLRVILNCLQSDVRIASPEISSFLILYQCFVFAHTPTVQTDDDLELCLVGINAVEEKRLNSELCACFSELVNLVFSRGLNRNEKVMSLILDHFDMNKSFEKTYFPLVVAVFRDIRNNLSQQIVDRMYRTLFAMLEGEQPIIDYDRVQDLVLICQPAVASLNLEVLMILGFLSNKSSDQVLVDACLQIPSALVQSFAGAKPIEYTAPLPPLAAAEYQWDMKLFESGFCPEFDTLPYDAIDNRMTLKEMIGEEHKELVLNVISFTKMCCATVREDFVKTAQHLMVAICNHDVYAEVMASFLWIFRETLTKDMLQRSMPSICNPGLLSDTDTVFNDESISVKTNSLRDALIDWLADIAPEFVLIVLDYCKSRVFITTELFIRIMKESNRFDMRILCHDKPVELMFDMSRMLMEMERSPCVERCWKSLFVFIHEMMVKEGFMINKLFSNRFLWHALDRSISGHIIGTWRNHMACVVENQEAVNSFRFMEQLLKFCLDEKEASLAVNVSCAMADFLRSNPRHIPIFYRHVSIMLDICRETNQREILIAVLTLLVVMSISRQSFRWSVAVQRQLVDLVRAFDGDDPKSDIRHLLFSLWAGSFAYDTVFLIRQPHALPIIMAVFGRSRELKTIMDLIEDLMAFSLYNTTKMSDGLLDLILIKYLNGQDVIRLSNNMTFGFAGDREQCARIFQKISLVKSSAAVVSELVDNIDTQEKAEFFVNLLSSARELGSVATFPIGVVPPQVSVSGINAKDLNGGFSVSFKLALDQAHNALAKFNTNLVTWTDSESNELKITLSGDVVACQLISQGIKTTVKLIKSIPGRGSFTAIMSFNMTEDVVKIYTLVNGQPENDSDLCEFKFADGPVSILIGGFGQKHGPKYEGPYFPTGLIYTVCLYSQSVNIRSSDFASALDGCQLFTTNILSEIALSTLEHSRITHSIAKGNRKDRITIETLESLGPPENILRTAVRSNAINEMIKKMLVPGLFASVEYLFLTDEIVQWKFCSLDLIVAQLADAPVDYYWYNQLYQVLCSITAPQLQVDWLERLILNMWIWRRCKPADLKMILRHWSRIVINGYTNIFEERQYLAQFIHQFRLYFDVVVTDDGIEHSPESRGGILGATYDRTDLIDCRDLFLQFIYRIAAVSCTELDLVVFFMHAKNCMSKEIMLCLLGFIRDIAPFLATDSYCTELSALISGDLDIDEAVIFAIHEVAKGNAYKRLFMIQESINSQELFDRLLHGMKKYPNLLPVLCMTSLKLKCHEKVLNTIKNHSNVMIEKVNENQDWFCYLFMIAFSVEGDEIELDVCRAVVMLMKQDRVKCIGAFLNMVAYAAPTLKPNLLFNFVKVCVEGLKTNFLWEMCFNYSMFHFFTNCFHVFVLEALKCDGVFADFELEPHPILLSHIDSLDDLRTVAEVPLTSLNIRFEYRLSPDGTKWLDQELGTMATRWVPKGTEYDIFLYVTSYFTSKATVPSEVLPKLEMRLDSFLQKRCEMYSSETKEYLQGLFHTLLANLDFSLTTTKPPQSKDEWSRMMKTEYLKISRAVERPVMTFVPDNTACLMCSPMKIKRCPNVSGRRLSKVMSYAHPVCQYSCIRVKRKSETTATFVLLKDCFIVDRSSTPLSSIRILLTRKRSMGDTAVEIWTTEGKSILLDFAPVTGSKIIKAFGKLDLKNVSLTSHKPSALLKEGYTTYHWQNRSMSNFDYIMTLNLISGRSYNDKYLYPIFPAVLQNFSLNTLTAMAFPTSDLLPQTEGLVCKSTILSPEYYYSPAIFDNDYEFVYKHRKVLESDEISEKLPVFFDRFFGYNMRKDFPHAELFSKPHVSRSPLNVEPVSAKTIYLLKKRHVAYASVVPLSPTEIEINAVTQDNASVILRLILDQDITISETQFAKGLCGTCGILSSFQQYTLMYDRPSLKATILKQGKVDRVIQLSSETNIAVCWDLGWVMWCPNDTAVWLKTDSTSRMICRTRSPILSLAANPLFKMFVVSTLDGLVSVYSMRNGALVKQTEFEEEILHLVVTYNFGFVLAFTNSSISLMDVNGQVIKKVPFHHQVLRTFLFSSLGNLDYVAFETASHKVAFFEAFYPENVVFLNGTYSGVVSICYAECKAAFLVLSQTGALNVVPQSITINCV